MGSDSGVVLREEGRNSTPDEQDCHLCSIFLHICRKGIQREKIRKEPCWASIGVHYEQNEPLGCVCFSRFNFLRTNGGRLGGMLQSSSMFIA